MEYLNENSVENLCVSMLQDENGEADLFHWEGEILPTVRIKSIFQPESPYAGAKIVFKLNFPTTYPNDPPAIVFTPPIYHPRVFQSATNAGQICLDKLLPKNWSPALKISNGKISGINCNSPY